VSGTKRGGRPPVAENTGKVEPTLPLTVVRCLETLVAMGLFGSSKAEVARYLIMRGVDDLVRAGTLRLPLPDTPPRDDAVQE
jgi:hypothetical protein